MITCSIVSCNTQKPETEAKGKDKIGPQELTLTSDIMTPEVLWAMGRIGEYSLSSDHSQIVYNVTYYSVEENRSGAAVFTRNFAMWASGLKTKSGNSMPKCQPASKIPPCRSD